MFFGMSFCLPIGWAYDYMQSRKQSSEKQSDTEPLLPALDQVTIRTHVLQYPVSIASVSTKDLGCESFLLAV